jgi:hypothetical protein
MGHPSPRLVKPSFRSPTRDELAPRKSTRKEPRSDVDLTLAVCGVASTGKLFLELCSTRNISRSGCCIHMRHRPQSDSALALRVMPQGVATAEREEQLLFQVAWLQPDGDGWNVGAYALGKSGLDRLAFPSAKP